MTNDIAAYKTKISDLVNRSFPELHNIVSDIFAKSILSILIETPSAHAISMKGFDFLVSKLSNSTVRVSPNDIFNAASHSIAFYDSFLDKNIIILIQLLNQLILSRNSTENTIQKLYKTNENLLSNVLIISSIPGIRDVSAVCILAETNIFNKDISNVFSCYQKLIAFFGTDPVVKQSGTSVKGRGSISKRGNSILRKKGRNLAFCIYQRNPVFFDYYTKKRNEAKSHNEALIALWNKVLRTIYSMLANKTLFDPNYALKAE